MSRRVGRREFVDGAFRLALVAGLGPDAAQAAGQRLGAADRRRLRAAVDTIIPAEGRMPAASAVGGVAYLEGMAARDAVFRALLVDGLRALDTRAMADIEKADTPSGFVPALRDAVYEAYYASPKVWKLIGYQFRSGPRRTAPLDPFDPQRVARVRAMGRLYRETK